MKFLVLALAVALLFSAGESVTDSPLNKQRVCHGGVGVAEHLQPPGVPFLQHKFETSL